MEFDIVAVTKLTVGIGVVWLLAMGGILTYLKHEKRHHKGA